MLRRAGAVSVTNNDAEHDREERKMGPLVIIKYRAGH